MRGKVNGHARELSALAFEQPALLAAIRLAGQKFPTRSHDAVPRNALS